MHQLLYVFKCFVFSANNFAMNAKRKTISPQDVLEAMKEMEFERFGDKLKQCLEGECGRERITVRYSPLTHSR